MTLSSNSAEGRAALQGRLVNMSYRVTSVVVAVLSVSTLSIAQEKRIKRSDLPPAVEKAVSVVSRGATVRGVSREDENGKTYYEIEMIVNSHSKDVLIDANGEVAEVEEDVPIDSLSVAVRDALQARAGKGKLQKVESLTKHGMLVAYEGQVDTNGKRSEVQVGPNGGRLDHKQ
jgi:hypothetical protein